MNNIVKKAWMICIATAFVLTSSVASAADHKMVIQVNSKSLVTQKMAMLHASNLKSQLGADQVDVEVVIYGPGLGLVKAESVFAKRITGLQSKGVVFSVCKGTLKAIKRKIGAEPELLHGIERVTTGALRILELQEQGWAYIRP